MRKILLVIIILLVFHGLASAKVINLNDDRAYSDRDDSDDHSNIVVLPKATYRKSKVSEGLDAYNKAREISINQQNANTQQADQQSLAAYRVREADARTAESNARIIEAQNSTEALKLRRDELQLELAKINQDIEARKKDNH